MRRQSLRLKIIAWSFVPTAILLVAVALVNLYAYQRVTEDLVIERDRELTRLMAGQLAGELGRYADLLGEPARQPALWTGERAGCDAALRGVAHRLAVFDAGVVALDDAGLMVACWPENAGAPGRNWSGQPFFQQAQARGRPVFSDIVTDARGAEALVVAVPLTDYEGVFRGCLAGMFRLGGGRGSAFYGGLEQQVSFRANLPEGPYYLNESEPSRAPGDALLGLDRLLQYPRLMALRTAGQGSAYLVDGTGRIIYHTDATRIGDRLVTQTAVQQVTERRNGAVRTRDIYGREIVASFAPVPDTPWGLVTEERWAALMQPSLAYQRSLLILLALGVAVPALVVWVGVRRITRPIKQLIGAAQRVAAGDFDQAISVPTRDEIRELAEQFSHMSARLRESYAHLEQRVADRTQELTTLNAIAIQVGRSLDLDEILRCALVETLAFMGLEVGAAFALDGPEGTLRRVAGRGLTERVTFSPDDPVARRMAEAGEPLCLSIADLPPGKWASALIHHGLRTLVSVPLVAKAQTLGLLLLGADEDRAVSSEVAALLASIGRQVGMAVENAQLYGQAQQAAALAERQRLARDLHDSVTQSLYGVTLYAKAAARLLQAGDAAQAAEHLAELQQTAQEALQEMRLLIFELRPAIVAEEGLTAALRARLEAVEGRAGLATTFTVEGEIHLPPRVEDGLYRIAQEAMNNALKHAQAHRIAVALRRLDDRVTLEIEDDGVGCDPEQARERGGLGWRGIQERAEEIGAELTITSCIGRGTLVRVEIRS